ncbi:MAG TPA: type 1 glutamine amidotransferase [Ktedonobacteraceae bacterium]|nr:type 1 glutamine amidotransferase [Ktedonobacteraceae bacterium]
MKRVLILQHCWDDPPGLLLEILNEHTIASELTDVESESVPDVTNYQALIIMGGPQHAPDDQQYPYLKKEIKQIRRAIQADLPILGICLGAQLLSLALGGIVQEHHTPELGFYRVELTENGKADPLFQGLPGYQQIYHWHSDVFSLPTEAIHLATNQNAENQAFRYGKWAYGLQYHMELTPEMLDTWLYHPEFREEAIRLAGADKLEQIEQEKSTLYPIYNEQTRVVFENFLKLSNLV